MDPPVIIFISITTVHQSIKKTLIEPTKPVSNPHQTHKSLHRFKLQKMKDSHQDLGKYPPTLLGREGGGGNFLNLEITFSFPLGFCPKKKKNCFAVSNKTPPDIWSVPFQQTIMNVMWFVMDPLTYQPLCIQLCTIVMFKIGITFFFFFLYFFLSS